MPATITSGAKARKRIALFLLLTISNQIVAPSITYALTSGPTAPEATSFEPVDTTDMVNPLTGDFTYNLPLLEVPGPEGGYPLSLSYHAGIQPNEEASWVGLGWSLNPGAITRSVNGYADDYADVTQIRRDYWSGGSRSTLGISVGTPAGVSFGLSFSKDTYQGFGVGGFVGFGFGIPNTPLGIGVSVGTDAYGNDYASVGLSISSGKSGTDGMRLGAGVGLSTNFESVGSFANAGISYGKHDSKGNLANYSLLGASISSSGGKASLTVGGGSANVHNGNAGKIQTESSGYGFGVPLPAGFSVGISYNYTRYWSDQTANVLTSGSLYMPQRQENQSYFDNRTYDIYRLSDHQNYNFVDHPDPDKLQGGTFPAFDDYTVTAQGLSGNMRPYIYQSILYSQNQTDVKQTSGAPANKLQLTNGVQYRFLNDFSNAYRQAHPNMSGLAFEFETPAYGNNDGTYGYNANSNHLAGSKHINWFSNNEINSNVAKARGFINTSSAGFVRMGNSGALTNLKGGQQVGGYMITNASGVTYHYALPAYSYGEYSHTELISRASGYKYTSQTKPEPYAYTWYLTAITGPDYVDRNNDGVVDEGDWGYWVSFDYGKWASEYQWRNPSQGYHRDIDSGYQSYSRGYKEIYYLDAVRTRSHTALFVKEIRADAKSAVFSSAIASYFPSSYGICNETVEDPRCQGCFMSEPSGTAYSLPRASLRLNDILLFQNDQLSSSLVSLRSVSNNYYHTFVYSGSNGCSETDKVHQGENVIDKFDISTSLEDKCLRKIKFNYDYSLSKGVPNSYDPGGTQTYTSYPETSPTLLGKLTLLSVDFRGKGGAATTPALKFEYDLDPAVSTNQDNITVTQLPTNRQGPIQVQTAIKFREGDIIRFSVSGIEIFCTLLKATGATTFSALYLDKLPTTTGATVAAYKTKNPPYNKDAYDLWGMYKSDYVASQNENLARLTTSVSNSGTDVWSLRKIKTSVGVDIDIDFEGDTYSRSILNDSKPVIITSMVKTSPTTFDLYLNTSGKQLSELYKVGHTAKSLVVNYNESMGYAPMGNLNFTVTGVSSNYISVSSTLSEIQSIEGNYGGNEFVAGNIGICNVYSNLGGGLRVRRMTVGEFSLRRSTLYSYNHFGEQGNHNYSSGVTSYEPGFLAPINFPSHSSTYMAAVEGLYKRELYKGMNYLLSISREVPAPGVMYEYVTVQDKIILPNGTEQEINGKTVYQYRVFNKGMLGVEQHQFQEGSTTHLKNLSIKDYTSQIGNLIRTIRYDDKGNKLAESVNHYLNDDIVDKPFSYQAANYESTLAGYNYQGVIQERYGDGRSFNNGGSWIYKMTMAGRYVYPAVQTGTTQIDYKNGTRVHQKNLKYDFYSGAITSTLTTDSYGNRFVSEVTPAYRKYDELGPKTSGTSGAVRKHMLTQQAASTTYKVNAANQPIGVVTASVQTWAKGLASSSDPVTANKVAVYDESGNLATDRQHTVWRQKTSFQWMLSGNNSNNLTPIASFQEYQFADGASNNVAWQKIGEIKRYNVFSNALEATDMYDNYAATRMGYRNSKVIVSGAPARYEEVTYAGAEDALLPNGKLSGNISLGTGSVVTGAANAHSGEKSLRLQPGQQGFTYEVALSQLDPTRRDYSVAVWVKPAVGNAGQARLYYKVGSGAEVAPAPSLAKTAAGWHLLELKVPASALASGSGALTVGCRNAGAAGSGDLYFDDFRFQPFDAAATAYVYDLKTGELSYVLDNHNLYTRYIYDGAGRLTEVRKEVLGKATVPVVSQTVYNYGRPLN